ncbi:hypothetical protein BD410DRAFT_846096 [Rickenella mellea]|uniref:Uncharacterized protein n=1 Tax=Rickenella mellea TaxID=50990 RepID=A0A4Y7PGC6_9AGAM|nr:hypothetical protein BD410DRAFT_846096 [Rickenella mellea]
MSTVRSSADAGLDTLDDMTTSIFSQTSTGTLSAGRRSSVSSVDFNIWCKWFGENFMANTLLIDLTKEFQEPTPSHL